jgi:hypothetical protein
MAQRYNKQINYEKMLQKNSLKFEHLKPSSIFQPEIWALLQYFQNEFVGI